MNIDWPTQNIARKGSNEIEQRKNDMIHQLVDGNVL